LREPADAGRDRNGALTFRQGFARIIIGMARVIALVHAQHRLHGLELLRTAIVCGCAVALIAAERVLPVIHL
jgi:hypothetical protein